MSTQVEDTISFSGRKTSYKDYYGRQENNDNIFKFKNEQQGLNTEEFRVSVTSVEGF